MTVANLPTPTPALVSSKHAHCSARMFFALLIAACAQLGISSTAHAQRVALLIGNSSYQSAPLTNPPNDVREMEAALKATGFKVQKLLNANQVQMKRAVRDFGEAAKGAELAFLYYSGHGTQIQGQNYLIPVGAEASINKESDYEIEAVSTNHIMGQIAAAEPRAAVVVLDSCRNNPFARSIKSAQKGMARIVSPQGILVAYATSPDNTADDNGYYAKALAGHITTPGLELVQVFRNTAKQVQKSSNGKQIPFIGDLSINDSVYLASIRPERVFDTPPPRISTCTDCPEMVVIPSGSFQMGSNDGDTDEKPVHHVSVKGFAIGKYEVTRRQFAAFVAATKHDTGDSCFVAVGDKGEDVKGRDWRNPGYRQSDEDPVTCVNWNDAQTYASWLSQKTKQPFRLPSEAEWEYACLGGARQRYCGSDDVDSVAWYEKTSDHRTHPVGQKRPNGFGLYDMSGNVLEWVQDWKHDTYSEAPVDGSAWEIGGRQEYRVQRGGAWAFEAMLTTATFRCGMMCGGNRNFFSGFRVARTLP